MYIRKSTEEDLPRMNEIYVRARRFMSETGNPNQWGPRNWPPEELLRSDIAAGKSYVCVANDGHVCGTFFFTYGPNAEPTYGKIFDGSWHYDDTYGVVHRIAADGSQKGIGTFCLNWAFRRCGHIRIDTHEDNRVMQNLLGKLGFERCGIIYVYEDTDSRIAFEKKSADLPVRKSSCIRTERLEIMPFRKEDRHEIARLLTDPLMTETYIVPDFPSEKAAEDFAGILIQYSEPEDTGHLQYGVYLDGRLIGIINDCGIDGDELELGYALTPSEWGHGYMTEAVTAVLADLRRMGFRRITAGHFEENTASRRVMEKCGFCPTERTGTEEYRNRTHKVIYRELSF